MCVQDIDIMHTGCLEPLPTQNHPEFVFYCPYCCTKKKKKFEVGAGKSLHLGSSLHSQFTRTAQRLADPSCLIFRFDPAVLFLDLRIPNYNGKWSDCIFPHLQQWYRGNENAVSPSIYMSLKALIYCSCSGLTPTFQETLGWGTSWLRTPWPRS